METTSQSQTSMIRIKFLRAGRGDASLISFRGNDSCNYNILLDAGPSLDYKYYLSKELDEIHAKGERLNLAVISHQDDDHALGFQNLLEDLRDGRFGEPKDFIQEYWFNCIGNLSNGGTELSAGTGATIEAFINQLGFDNKGMNIVEGMKLELGGAEIDVLSPTVEQRERWKKKYESGWIPKYDTELGSSSSNDYSSTLIDLKTSIIPKDGSIANAASIAFLLTFGGVKCLFLGDSVPDTITNSLRKRGFSADKPISVDLLKLSHHGGIRNISEELLDTMIVRDFAISTNQCPPKPSKATIAKILGSKHYSGNCRFLFNYGKDTYKQLWSLGDFSPEVLNFQFPGQEETFYLWES